MVAVPVGNEDLGDAHHVFFGILEFADYFFFTDRFRSTDLLSSFFQSTILDNIV